MASDMAPQSLAEVRELKNVRSAALDLDSLYGAPAPADPANTGQDEDRHGHRHRVDRPPGKKPKGKTKDNDLPRRGRSSDKLKIGKR